MQQQTEAGVSGVRGEMGNTPSEVIPYGSKGDHGNPGIEHQDKGNLNPVRDHVYFWKRVEDGKISEETGFVSTEAVRNSAHGIAHSRSHGREFIGFRDAHEGRSALGLAGFFSGIPCYWERTRDPDFVEKQHQTENLTVNVTQENVQDGGDAEVELVNENPSVMAIQETDVSKYFSKNQGIESIVAVEQTRIEKELGQIDEQISIWEKINHIFKNTSDNKHIQSSMFVPEIINCAGQDSSTRDYNSQKVENAHSHMQSKHSIRGVYHFLNALLESPIT